MKSGNTILTILGCALMIFSCDKNDDDPSSKPPAETQECFEIWEYTDQLPNMDFEQWESPLASGNKYEEPCGGVWATGNGGTALVNKVTTYKTEVAQNGAYAAEMETVLAFGTLSGGSIFAGDFILNLANPAKSAIQGVPFTARPKSLKGYYKYSPVNGDSSNVLVLLTKFNPTEKKRDTVGFGELPGYTEVTDFKEFEVMIDYSSYSAGNEVPDSVSLSFTSSKAAEFFIGQVGSKFVVDNCKFTY